MQYVPSSTRNIINTGDVNTLISHPEQINEYSLLYAIQVDSYTIIESMLELDEDLLFKLVEECVRIGDVSKLLWVIGLREKIKSSSVPISAQKKFQEINWNVTVNELTPLTLLISAYEDHIIPHIDWLLFEIKVIPDIRKAIEMKNLPLLTRMLQAGANPCYDDLLITMYLGYDTMFKLLIDYNVPICSVNKQDCIINRLTRYNRTKLLEYVLERRSSNDNLSTGIEFILKL